MTAKEKAKELYELNRYHISLLRGTEALIDVVSQRCAIIAVDTVLGMASHYATIEYWEEVKTEIEKL